MTIHLNSNINSDSPKPYSKMNPTKNGSTFIPIPSDVRHYIYHPIINADKLFLYTLIIDYYNESEGYAFPTLVELEMSYGKHRDTVSKHLDDLKTVGLVDFPKEKGSYIPLTPLPKHEFFTRFPDADTAYKKALKKRDRLRDSARERRKKWREDNGYI